MTFSSSSKTATHSSIGRPAALNRLAAALVGAAALSLSSNAFAVTSTSFTYSAPKTGYLVLQPGDALPTSSTSADGYKSSASGGLECTRTDIGCAFTLPIHLPNGAKIVSFTVYFSQTAAGGVYGFIERTTLANGAGINIMGGSSNDASNTRKTIVYRPLTGAPTVVQNGAYIYDYFVILNGPNYKFYGGKITYTYTNAGD